MKTESIAEFIWILYHYGDIKKLCTKLINSMPKCVKMLFKNTGYHGFMLTITQFIYAKRLIFMHK